MKNHTVLATQSTPSNHQTNGGTHVMSTISTPTNPPRPRRPIKVAAIAAGVTLCLFAGRAAGSVFGATTGGPTAAEATTAPMETAGSDLDAPASPIGSEDLSIDDDRLGAERNASEGTTPAVVSGEEWTHVEEPDIVEVIDAPSEPAEGGDADGLPDDEPGEEPIEEAPAGPVFGGPTRIGKTTPDQQPSPVEGHLPDAGGGTTGTATPVPTLGVDVHVETLGHFAEVVVLASLGRAEVTGLELDFGDGDTLSGTPAQVTQLGRGRAIRVVHEYDPTLTFDHHVVMATITDADGATDTTLQPVDTRVYYVLSYSAITVRAFNDCDTIGKGDFELTWNQDGRERSSSFDLGAGDWYVEDRFRGVIHGVFYDVDVPLELELRENDPAGAWLAAPWKWDGFKFEGVPGTGGGSGSAVVGPVAQFGDHHYQVERYSTSDWGLPGDDDCAAGYEFTVSLHMIDDIHEALAMMRTPPSR